MIEVIKEKEGDLLLKGFRKKRRIHPMYLQDVLLNILWM